ncbi:MAG: 3-hydroxybutyryl-CoA dehydrogenase [Ignavibacteriae bacterium HGW-Ignavibacteriae-3]|nr:MAG: 3-hydroxybutyryl-CoA dehydrogenase [Ignavibacteriae bacterium HGW-Ignavibacteriae-3]
MDIKKVAVIGAGTMGSGIAQVFASKNYSVVLMDTEQGFIDRGLKNINNSLDRLIKKNTITRDQYNSILKNISTLTDLDSIPGDIDLVIEAVVENKSVKMSIYNKLHSLLPEKTIFTSNTSSISITELGSGTRPDRFIGMHFMNPVPLMQLVEIIRGYATSDSTFSTIKQLSIELGKTPVEVFDYPGFVANRILMPMINEAIYSLFEGVASAEDIDTVMKLGMNHPMGPLTLADFIGLDVCLAIMEVLYTGFNDSKYRPCPLLKKMVAAGKLGRKSKEGFFKYN